MPLPVPSTPRPLFRLLCTWWLGLVLCTPQAWAGPDDDKLPVDAPDPLSPVVRFHPGDGLKATSRDGRFAVRVSARLQLLYVLQRLTPDADLDSTFLIRRARIILNGHMFSPDVRYKFELAVSARDQGVDDTSTGDETFRGPTQTPLLDGILEFTHLRDLEVKGGQYKVHFSRERVISSGKLQFVDRSLANAEFNLDRDTGINLSSDALGGLQWLRYDFSLTTSDGRSVTDTQPRPPGFSPMILGRVEVLPFGPFDDYIEADLERHRTFKLSIGGSYAYIVRPSRDRGILGSPTPEDVEGSHHATGDILFKYRGWSLLTDGYWRRFVGWEGGRNGWAFNAQSAFLMPGFPLELGLRYTITRPESQRSEVPDQQEGTFVWSWYFHGHAAKLQTDLSWRAVWAPETRAWDQGWRWRVTTSFIF